jgi:hypothetical protein
MKKIIVIFICIFFLLSAGANAGERECYKLENGAMLFVSVLNINHITDLVRQGQRNEMFNEYFNDLVSRKLAFQTNKELIVYKFDHFRASGIMDVVRVKLQNETVVEFIDTVKETTHSVKLPAGYILGWTFENSLKKIKAKK